MSPRTFSTIAVLLSGAIVAEVSSAAPPTLETLFPAGGQIGKTVDVTVRGNVGGTNLKGWSNHPDLKIVVPPKGGKSLQVVISEKATPGLAWIRVANDEGASALRPFLIGTLPEIQEKEPNELLAQATPIPEPGAVANGILEKSADVDMYSIPLKKGETLVCSVVANDVLGSPVDAVLQVLSPRGFVADQNHDGATLDPFLTMTAREDGPHFVRIFGFSSTPNTSVAFSGSPTYIYRLTITKGPYIDFALPLSVTKGQKTKVELKGWNIPAAQSFHEITAPATDNGTVMLWKAGFAGAIPLNIAPVPSVVEVEPNDSAKPQSVPLPAIISGTISTPGDIDAFSFAGKKGKAMSIRVEANSLGQVLDPVIKLYGIDGKLLREVDTRTYRVFDESIDFNPTADGTYRVEVHDLYRAGGPRYSYRLSLLPIVPAVSLTVAAEKFTFASGKPLEIPVTLTYRGATKEPVELHVLGLPKEVKAPVVTVKPAEKTAKIVLTSDTKTAINAHIRIVARTKSNSMAESAAEAPSAITDVKVSDLWLTVLPPGSTVAEVAPKKKRRRGTAN